MKTTILILSLLALYGCNESQRKRLGDCKNAEEKLVVCPQSEEQSVEAGFKSKYITSVSIPVTVSETRIIFDDSALDTDEDDMNLVCALDVGVGTNFTYNIEEGLLILKNGITVLKFRKVSGKSTNDLIGKWSLKEKVSNKFHKTTEFMIFDLENLRITQTCDVK